MAFSLIVNRQRDHRIYAVRKATCPFCGRSEVRGVPARITPDPRCAGSAVHRVAMRSQLKQEIEAKICFEPDRDVMRTVPW